MTEPGFVDIGPNQGNCGRLYENQSVSCHFELGEESLSRWRRHLMPKQRHCYVFNVKASVEMIRLVFIHPLRYVAG